MSKEENKISILGCGWLGLPLAERLIKDGYEVNGTTRSRIRKEALVQKGVNPFIINLSGSVAPKEIKEFLDAHILIINIPPTLSNLKQKTVLHSCIIEQLIGEIRRSSIKRVIYVSSTSVYKNTNGIIDEECQSLVTSGKGGELIKAENLLKGSVEFKTTVMRMAGLFGYDRMPYKVENGVIVVNGSNLPVNLVHRDDCIEIICKIAKQDKWGEVYNICNDDHPIKKELFSELSKNCTVQFNNREDYKIISCEKLKKDFCYKFSNKISLSSQRIFFRQD